MSDQPIREPLPADRPARRYDFNVHWHPAGADELQQQLLGDYSSTRLCPCQTTPAARSPK